MGVPSVSGSASVAASHAYKPTLNATPQLIFSGRGNLYGFLVEDMSGADVFIQFFDAASAGAVTVGTTVPVMTMRIKADQSFGKDVNDSPLRFFGEGCVVAVTTERLNAVSPATAAVGNFWYHARNFSL